MPIGIGCTSFITIRKQFALVTFFILAILPLTSLTNQAKGIAKALLNKRAFIGVF